MIELIKSYISRLITFLKVHKLSILILLIFLVVAIIMYYPLSFNLGTRSVEDVPKDSAFNMWIMGWGSYALTHAPWRFFEANMFYPFQHVLAWGDNLFSVTLVATPLIMLFGIVIAYNSMLVISMALSGFTMFLLIKHLTKNVAAGFLAGVLWCVSVARLTSGYMQVLPMYWIPLIFLFSEKLRAKDSKKYFWFFVISLFMQLATGIYIAIYTIIALGIYFVALAAAKKLSKQLVWTYAKALAITGGLCIPIYLPSMIINFAHPTVRPVDQQVVLQWNDINPLFVPGLLFSKTAKAFGAMLSYRPSMHSLGLLLCFFLVASMVIALTRKGRMAKMHHSSTWAIPIAFLVIGIFGVLSTFGAHINLWDGRQLSNPFFTIPYQLMPGYKVMRIPARWEFIGTFGLAAFIGYYMSLPLKRIKPVWQVLVLVSVTGWLIIEHGIFNQGKHTAPNYATSPVYEWLSEQPGKEPIAELPVYPGKYYINNDYIEGPRTYFAAMHLRPRTGGAYSPFIPGRYTDQAGLINSLGDNPKTITYLKEIGIKYVILLPQDFKILGWDQNLGKLKKQQFDQLPYLTKVFDSDNGIAYEIH